MALQLLILILIVISWLDGGSILGNGVPEEAGHEGGPHFSSLTFSIRPISSYCSTTHNFTASNQYRTNLIELMDELPPNAIANRNFDNATVGNPPDKVFGLIMCYADSNSTSCRDCLQAAGYAVQQECPFSREVKATFDACLFRYSNESFFSVADTTVTFNGDTPTYGLYMDGMNSTRLKLMSQLAEQAAGSLLRLANGSTPYTDSQGGSHVIYGLAQCTRDLSTSECARCLTTFLANLPPPIPYGNVKGYSCYMA